MSKELSDEILNAYVDSQLDECDIEHIQSLVEKDLELKAKIEELRQLKKMVRLARPAVDTRDLPKCTHTAGWWNRPVTLAATLFVCVIATSLVYWQYNLHSPSPTVASVEKVLSQIAQLNVGSEVKLVLHVRHADKASTEKLLQQVETLLTQAKRYQRNLRIEVVANGKGLDLLRQDRSPFPQRIRQLHASHDNLSFMACSDTMKRLKISGEKVIPLLPQATIVTSVNQQIEMRQQQGWTYISV